jgi:hypothetical protein
LLISHDAAVVVHDGGELTTFVRRCLENPGWGTAIGTRAQGAVLSQQGAAEKTVALLAKLAQQHSVLNHRSAA